MKQLPTGVYVVSKPFQEGAVTFTFKGEAYEATVGVNAFPNFESLATQPLEAVTAPFLGYSDVPVILVPAGICPIGNIGKTNAERFRTYFPRVVAILGENAGISPNGPDLRTPAPRAEESVIECSLYFGRLCLKGEIPGTMTIDGLTLRTRVLDERTGGENAGLVVKNCIMDAPVPNHIIWVHGAFAGNRTTTVTDCRADGINAMNADGSLVSVCSGQLTMERLYMANTKKFLGMTNFTRTTLNGISALTLRDSLFENSCSYHGLSLRLPEDSAAAIRIENCDFLRFTPEDDPVISANLPEQASMTVHNCRFAGHNLTPAIETTGAQPTVTDCTAEGFTALWREKQPRRTAIDPATVYPITDPHAPVEADFAPLDDLYADRKPYHGDFHCHSNSGGTSDGQAPLEEYVPTMKTLDMDFAAIVDHKQMRHFFLPEWDEQYLICGTEPGCVLDEPDRPACARKLDYTMIFPDKTGLAQVMGAFPQFQYTGGWNGHYTYVNHTLEQLRTLADYVYSIGGLLTHAHPKQLIVSDDPMDYYIGENVPLETIHGGATTFATRQNRELWMQVLALGKRVRTHGSSDSHGPVSNRGLTTVYAPRHFSTDIFNCIRAGDCTAGAVGIRMSIGDTPMGSVAPYAPGKRLLIRVDDFHPAHREPDTVYSLRVYTDKGLAYVREFDGSPQSLALPVEDRQFYRVEIFNESDGHTTALGNPIWLD